MNITCGAALVTLFLALAMPTSGLSHEGERDRFGCHQDKEHGTYHCHDGMLKGGSFNSKGEMVKQLKRQLETLGRPWPYGDDLIEEDITSPNPNLKARP